MVEKNRKSAIVVNHLKQRIQKGIFPIGSKLPSENTLAEEIGVSRVTVRTALEILKKEGYIESHQGSGSFVTANHINKLIPVILSTNSSESRFVEIYLGIQDFFTTTTFTPLLLISEANPKLEKELICQYYKENSTNMIILPFSSEDNKHFFNSLIQKNANIVFIDMKPNRIDCNYVASCNFIGGYTATKKLIELGHKNIGFCANTNILNSNTLYERFNGYKFAFEESNIEYNPNLVFEKTQDSIKDFAQYCFENSGNATAMFCCSDGVALSVSSIFKNANKQIAIIGYDNTSLSETASPQLTTINQDFYKIGYVAAEMLYNSILNPNQVFENKYIPIKLIERESTNLAKKPTEI